MSQTMAKALRLLDLVAPEGKSLAELTLVSGMPKSTTHRLATVLLESGFLRLDGHRYELGYRLMELGERAKDRVRLPALGRPHMETLSRTTGETIHLGELVGRHVMYVEKVEGARGLQMRSRVGLTSPAGTTAMGKAIIAFLPEERWPDFFVDGPPRTPNTITEWPSFEAELATTRARGHAYDREENELGICCVSAPVFDASGSVRAAVSLSGATMFLPAERLEDLAGEVRAGAASVSRELGWTGQHDSRVAGRPGDRAPTVPR